VDFHTVEVHRLEVIRGMGTRLVKRRERVQYQASGLAEFTGINDIPVRNPFDNRVEEGLFQLKT